MTSLRMQVRKLVPARLRPRLGDLRRRLLFNPGEVRRQKGRLLASDELDARQKELLKKTSATIHYRDGMYAGDAASYFKAGLSAIECVEDVLAKAGRSTIQTVLDLPSGYGRELRFFVQRFPEAQFTACDIQPRAVEFCAREFGANGVCSQQDLNQVSFENSFDLIWCGSLITHLNRETIDDLLALFARHLKPGGVMIFTAHGDHVLERMRNKRAAYDLRPEDIPAITDSYELTGYGYHDYPRGQGYFDFHPKGTGYGISLTSPDWIREQLKSIGGLREIYFKPRGWAEHQDVYGFQKFV